MSVGDQLEVAVTVDNVGGNFDGLPRRRGRGRTVNLMFDYMPPTMERPDGSFRVLAHGSAVPDDGGGPWIGWTNYGPRFAYAAMTDLRRTWTERVIEFQAGRKKFPFSEKWDLSGDSPLDEVGIDLARAGNKLFDLLFRRGDAGLDRVADLVADALRSGEQRISVFSDRLFAPWPILYTSPDATVDVAAAGAPWQLEGSGASSTSSSTRCPGRRPGARTCPFTAVALWWA